MAQTADIAGQMERRSFWRSRLKQTADWSNILDGVRGIGSSSFGRGPLIGYR